MCIRDRKDSSDLNVLKKIIASHQEFDANRVVRAIYLLGEWGEKSIAKDISKLIPHVGEIGRVTILDVLTKIGDESVFDEIKECLKDKSPQVRKFAIYALGALNSHESVHYLQEVGKKDSLDFIRGLANEYLKNR